MIGACRCTWGLKSSGYFKDLSLYALEDYTVPRHVMVKR
jgi:aminobutyraldehyde dehydrogenase